MAKKRKGLKYTLAAALCLALAAAFFLASSGGAYALTSLPHIEEIVSSVSAGDVFNILEIIPKAGSGSIGYYINGQEPISNLGYLLSGETSENARRNAVNALFTNLEGRGIIGSTSGTPLTYSGPEYAEKKPWQMSAGDYSVMKSLVLSAEETASVNGSFSQASGGDYDKVMQYTKNVSGAANDHVQIIDHFVYATGGETGVYYYSPEFSEFSYDAESPPSFSDGTAVYAMDDDSHYLFVGYWGSDSLALDISLKYYVVANPGVPTDSYSAGCYAAVSSDFRAVEMGETGYFSLVCYVYAGDGLGHYDFTSGGSAAVTVKYNTVYYSLGYVNNNWLLKYVFDQLDSATGELTASGSTMGISLKSALPGDITANDIKSADLIILSAGFNAAGGNDVSYYGSGNDIDARYTGGVYDAVITANGTYKPIIADMALVSSSAPNLSALALFCTSGKNADFVNENIYCFSGALASQAFSAGALDSAGFAAVLSEIQNENFLRLKENSETTDLLPENITMATTIRYIINYAGQRPVGTKTSGIRVLDLEPGKATTNKIDAATVRSWLGDPSTSVIGPITVDTMSTAEFIGKIDDLLDTYDMIYIGSSIDGFYTTGSGPSLLTDYNDPDMDGLIYANIGDTYVTNYLLTGLRYTDYSTAFSGGYRKINSDTSTRTFRFSGNDITASKADQLEDFVNAGYPVVISDKLLTGASATSSFTFSVAINATISGGSIKLTASASTSAYSVSYQWYRNGTALSGETAGTCTFSPSAGTSDSYYCTATITVGGTAYTAVSNTKTVNTEKSNLQLSYIGAGKSGSSTATTTTTYHIGLTPVHNANGSNTFTVTSWPDLPEDTTYTWYRASANGGSYSQIKGASGSQYTTNKNHDYRYYCRVTLPGQSDYGYTEAHWYISTSRTFGDDYDYYYPSMTETTSTSFTVRVQSQLNSDILTLTAYTDPSIGSATFRWYRSTDNGGTYNSYPSGESISVSSPGYLYYCQCTPSSGTFGKSPVYKVVSGVDIGTSDSSAGSQSQTIPAQPASISINSLYVDRASNIYTALNTILGYGNTLSSARLSTSSATYSSDSSKLFKYVNLSKPKIDWIETSDTNALMGYPTEYTIDTSGTMSSLSAENGKYYLRYVFKIENATDPTPKTTTYDCRLFIDLNSNGLYETEEQITDIVVRDSGGTVISPILDKSDDYHYELAANVQYTVSRQMPDSSKGLIPWKLEVIKNGTFSYIRASEHNYSRIAGTATQLNILQIMCKDGSGLNLNTSDSLRTVYDTELGKIGSDFAVDIDTVYSNYLDSSASWKVTRNGSTTNYQTLAEYLGAYDMLILGFNDVYKEISEASANAILAYSNDHAVLFTHDATSRCNLPFNAYPTAVGSVGHGDYYWGYNFNTILRSKVYLDRYGITDETYGRTKQYLTSTSEATESNRFISYGALDLTNANVQNLIVDNEIVNSTNGNHYTIAYKPKSAAVSALSSYAWETVPEVQGVGLLEIIRQTDGSGQKLPSNLGGYNTSNGNCLTTAVSQVNEGQITTYPFNLNTRNFTDATSTSIAPLCNQTTMTVASTHSQYYQLNMNSDNIVVWYCLAGSPYDNIPNDVVNNYYIYTVGNITYSGAGHAGSSMNSQSYLHEADLFINTMIAAYRTAVETPTISFTSNASGSTEVNYKFVASDYTVSAGDTLSASGSFLESDATNIYFKITDPTLKQNKEISLSFSYQLLNSSTANTTSARNFSPAIYDASTGAETSYLRGGYVYYIRMPSELLDELGENPDYDSVRITVTVSSSIGTGTNSTSIEIRRIGLFPLA